MTEKPNIDYSKIDSFMDMLNEENREYFEDSMNKLTAYYQDIYKFNPDKGTYNNRGDAFKHTFGSAYMAIHFGNMGSKIGGIKHELDTSHNPDNEWNMDSWNNREGRKIAKEILQKYGKKAFLKLPYEVQNKIIAERVIEKLNNGELIASPYKDERIFSGRLEEKVKRVSPIVDAYKDFYDRAKEKFESLKNEAGKIFSKPLLNHSNPPSPSIDMYPYALKTAYKAYDYFKKLALPLRLSSLRNLEIIYRINRSGRLSHLELKQSSGNELLDNLMLYSIEKMAPYDKFPSEFTEDSHGVHLTLEH